MSSGKHAHSIGDMAAGSWDRCRLRERFQAALAGLQELHMLRQQQEKLVIAALAMDDTLGSTPTDNNHQITGCREHPTAQKGNMSHLRNHLDQQISALKLDVDKSSIENLESDSRPSSGFYELSDFSSCSLSNSCTSVYSECLSSMCKGAQKCRNYFKVFEQRPRSTDEKCVSHQAFTRDTPEIRTNGSLLNIQGNKSQRPVSTGDLERFIQMYHGFQNNSNRQSISTFDVKDDPKYQKDLISKNRNEIYNYPSPLHAVALQSPIFSLSTESQNKFSTENDYKAMFEVLPGCCLSAEIKPKGYTNQLVQVKKCQEMRQLEFSPENTKKPSLPHHILEHCPILQKEMLVSSIESDIKEQGHIRKIELQLNEDTEQNLIYNERLKITLPVPSGTNPSLSTSHPSIIHQHTLISLNDSASKASQDSEQSISYTSPKEHSTPNGIHAIKNIEQCEFVQAKFIPAESHRVKMRVSTSKNVLINVKRRNSEQFVSPSPIHMVEQPIQREPARLKNKCVEHCKPKGGRIRSPKRPPFSVATAHRSYSKDRLYPDQKGKLSLISISQVNAPSKTLYSPSVMEVQPNMDMTHKWKSSVDISANKKLYDFSRRPQSVWVQNRKSLKKVWVTHSKHMDINNQSESEFSSECASLFHSTVLDSSDVASEYTTNRFGDIGSSDTDSKITTSDSSLSLNSQRLDMVELKWADNTSKTPVTSNVNRHLQPEPKMCRIKASKALKKKIRRFQPTSLKIITMI